MSVNQMGSRLRAGEVLLGLCNMYPAAGIIESISNGWDFVWIDGQHGQIDYRAALSAVQTAAGANGGEGIETLLRVPSHDACILGPWSDIGPSALMMPMVNTKAQADWLVSQLRFPPLGTRSYGGRRVIDTSGRDYYKERELLVVAQVETVESVTNASAIIGTEGIDMLFFGPDDMKAQLGLPINTPIHESPELREAMQKTADAAKGAGKFAACVAPNPPTLEMAVEMGFQLCVGGGDVLFMRTLAAERLSELRGTLKGDTPADGKRDQAQGMYGGR